MHIEWSIIQVEYNLEHVQLPGRIIIISVSNTITRAEKYVYTYTIISNYRGNVSGRVGDRVARRNYQIGHARPRNM